MLWLKLNILVKGTPGVEELSHFQPIWIPTWMVIPFLLPLTRTIIICDFDILPCYIAVGPYGKLHTMMKILCLHMCVNSFDAEGRIFGLIVNTMPADAQAPEVARASRGMLLIVYNKQYVVLLFREFHLLLSILTQEMIQIVNKSLMTYKIRQHVKSWCGRAVCALWKSSLCLINHRNTRHVLQ